MVSVNNSTSRRRGAPALRRQRQVGQRQPPVRHLGARPVHPLAVDELGLRRQAAEGPDGRGRAHRRRRLPARLGLARRGQRSPSERLGRGAPDGLLGLRARHAAGPRRSTATRRTWPTMCTAERLPGLCEHRVRRVARPGGRPRARARDRPSSSSVVSSRAAVARSWMAAGTSGGIESSSAIARMAPRASARCSRWPARPPRPRPT